MNENVSIAELGTWLEKYQTFALMSHMRPDGDAIGSQLGLGLSLEAMGKTVHYWNVDGLPESLAFLAGSEKITKPPEEAPEIDVAIALDTATRVRLGEENLLAAAKAKVWLNIDHHISNPLYGDVNYVDATSPATGQIVYEILQQLQMPLLRDLAMPFTLRFRPTPALFSMIPLRPKPIAWRLIWSTAV